MTKVWGGHVEALQSRTGLVQGQNRDFPVKFSHTGKNLFSLQGFPCEKNFTGKTLFSLQGRVCREFTSIFSVKICHRSHAYASYP